MAVTYWDYWGDSTGGTLGDAWFSTNTTTTSTGTSYIGTTWASCTTTARRVRQVIVKTPKKWSKAIRAAYTRLVNDETDTGWKVTMWISGKIKITDPDVEVRSMKDFIPLLKSRASPEDRSLIDKFFEKAGVK